MGQTEKDLRKARCLATRTAGAAERGRSQSLSKMIGQQFRQSDRLSSIRHQFLDDAWRKQQSRRIAYERYLEKSCTGNPITPVEWDAICEKYAGKCLSCGTEADLTMDHVVPLSRGGRDSADNIQPLCRSCNSAKGKRTKDYRPHN